MVRPRKVLRNCKEIPHIPIELLIEIFYNLPYKTIARFKLICKEWNSILSNPDFFLEKRRRFAGSQLIILESIYHKATKSRVMINTFIRSESKHLYNYSIHADELSLQSLGRPPLIDKDNIDYIDSVQVLGSYNGLVAITYNNNRYTEFVLWNPITHQYSFQESASCVSRDRDVLYGLCYDASYDKYSVIVVTRYYGSNYVANLVDLVNNSDKRIKIINIINLLDGADISTRKRIGMVICGVPHWMVEYQEFDDKRSSRTDVLYFDLQEEMFKKLLLDRVVDNCKSLFGLANLDGQQRQLGVVLKKYSDSSLEVWAMKEYGKQESWVHLFTTPDLNCSLGLRDMLFVTPNRGLWMCDLRSNKLTHINDCSWVKNTTHTTLLYEPSLINPKPMQCLHWIPPKKGVLKWNVSKYPKDSDYQNAAYRCVGIGGVLRDWNGRYLYNFSSSIVMKPSKVYRNADIVAVLRAIELSLSKEWIMKHDKIFIESDNRFSVYWFKSPCRNINTQMEIRRYFNNIERIVKAIPLFRIGYRHRATTDGVARNLP